jgi:hypothetical protein
VLRTLQNGEISVWRLIEKLKIALVQERAGVHSIVPPISVVLFTLVPRHLVCARRSHAVWAPWYVYCTVNRKLATTLRAASRAYKMDQMSMHCIAMIDHPVQNVNSPAFLRFFALSYKNTYEWIMFSPVIQSTIVSCDVGTP